MTVKMIEGDDRARASKCMAEIQNVLDRYDCTLLPRLEIVGGQIQHAVAIVLKDRNQTLSGKILTPQGMKLG